ncbi:MAG: PorT family protein [Sphingobacteriales bacterium]|nr:PorT family protein [Sphingobacteriales bacterium]
MKKAILSALLVVAFAAVNAQDVKFGLKAGLNISTFSGSDASGSKSKAGFYAGGLVNIPVSGGFSVQPELVYSGEGAKGDDGNGGTATQNLNYLNIPVLAKYTFNGGFFAETGPQIGFLLSAKAKGGGVSVDDKDAFKSTAFSWGVGVGYTSSANIGGSVRYNLGISKIDKDGASKAYNNVFQVGLHYIFGGGAKK